MEHVNFSPLLQRLRHLAGREAAAALSDRALLEEFACGKNEAAFAELVERCGPMVLNVCRRILRHEHDAEDAFQATFMILSRKARAIRRTQAVAAWLHGVARRTALKARRTSTRRQRHEREKPSMAQASAPNDVAWREVQAALDDEIQRLPRRYRDPFLLCVMEGRSRAETAAELGCKEGTVASRVARARERLQKQLAGRGITLSAVLAALSLSGAAHASLKPALARAAIQAGLASLAGKVAAAKMSPQAATLAKSVLHAMTMAKAKVLCLVVAVACVASGFAAQILTEAQSANSEPHKKRTDKQVQNERKVVTDQDGDPLPANAIVRLGTRRFRHGGDAWSIGFSPDGRFLASTTLGGVVIWDAATGREIRRLQDSLNPVVALDFSPDSAVLVTQQTNNHALRTWDVATGKPLRTIDRNGSYRAQVMGQSLRFSPKGEQVAVTEGSRQGKLSLTLLNPVSGQEVRRLQGFTETFSALAFSRDGSLVAAMSNAAGALRVYEVATGKVMRTMQTLPWGHGLDFSPDGRTLAVPSRGHIALLDVRTGREQTRLNVKESNAFLAFTPDGKTLISADYYGTLRFWDWERRTERFQIAARLGGWGIHAVALSRDGTKLAVGSGSNAVRVWDAISGKELFTRIPGHRDQLTCLAFSPDGRLLASGAHDADVLLWNTKTWKPYASWPRHKGTRVLSFSGNGKRLTAVGQSDQAIGLYDVAGTREIRQFRPLESDRPEWLYGAGQDFDGNIVGVFSAKNRQGDNGGAAVDMKGQPLPTMQACLWDSETGRKLEQWNLGRFLPFHLALSSDGRGLVLGGNEAEIPLWDLSRHRKLAPLLRDRGGAMTALTFSPDGRMVAVAGLEQTVSVWEAATAKEVVRWRDEHCSALAFTSQGRVLAGQGIRGIRFWDLATGRELPGLNTENSAATALAFSPDGAWLAAGLYDTTILIWDVHSRTPDNRSAVPLPGNDLDRVWAALASEDAVRAHRAVWSLIGSPIEATSLLRNRLKPAVSLGRKHLQRLFTDLGNPQFAVREAAAKKLESFGEDVEPILRQKLADRPASLEVSRRLERLLEKIARPSAEERRALRAVMVLEHTGMPEAHELLKTLARGAPAARLTRDANAALRRLARQRLEAKSRP